MVQIKHWHKGVCGIENLHQRSFLGGRRKGHTLVGTSAELLLFKGYHVPELLKFKQWNFRRRRMTLCHLRQFWWTLKKSMFWNQTRRHLSGQNTLDSRNTFTPLNQQLRWDALWRWWLDLSLLVSLFIPIFCVLLWPLRDCLYRHKDVGGWLYIYINTYIYT